MAAGKFITFEGGEGVGKSTQAGLLADDLRNLGHEVVLTREPGGAPAAEDIRNLLVEGAADRWEPVSEALLLYAARREHVRRTIRPALAAGTWVVCDRFADSTLAYQGHGHQLGPEFIGRLHDLVMGGFTPDLTIILDLPEHDGLARAHGRGGGATRYERIGGEFHRRVRQGFREIAARVPGRCVLIDAGVGVEDVRGRVRAAVAARLAVRF